MDVCRNVLKDVDSLGETGGQLMTVLLNHVSFGVIADRSLRLFLEGRGTGGITFMAFCYPLVVTN